MKLIVTLAIIAGLLLALFLWFRPVVGSMGTPAPPNVKGRASQPVADGTGGGATQGPPASTIGPPIPRPGAADAARAGIAHSDEIEREILELVNQERAKVGAGPLQLDTTLQDAARGHSDDMFVRAFFAHEDPDGFSASDRLAKAHRQLIGLTGENIWMGTNMDLSDQKKLAASIMNNWMNSPGHKDNILKKDYTHLGVGVAVKGRDVRATQNFAAVYALTEQAVPAEVRGGEGLNLAARPVGAGPPPDRFEFFSSDKGVAVGGARPIAGATVPEPKEVPAGIYKLRFIFPQGNAYWGPRVEVK
ncbi:MAG TPA: CAP domain-containing protein [Pyrinomonadaceae bacterium]|nr:CAP domain-containing protein [Pyrinomonadaceae bacterium]